MQNGNKNKTITEAAKEHLIANYDTVRDVAKDLDRSPHTVNRWIWTDLDKFMAPASLRIIARRMGKKVSEIVIEKTEV